MASSLAELESELRAELLSAMEEAADKMFDDLQGEVAGYYSGSPKAYRRTFQLLSTPTLSPVSGGGNSVSFMVYLNPAGGYTSGSYPSMQTVLHWTNDGGGGTIGNHGYWERAESKMGQTFTSVMASHFG